MAAGDEQQKVGERETVGQPGREGVAFEMVDRVERFAGRSRQRLGRHQPDDKTADQAGAGRRRDRVDIPKVAPGAGEGMADEIIENLDMGACRDLRHDAAKGRMLLDLRADDVGHDPAGARRRSFDNRGGGLVAACLDSEDPQWPRGRTSRVFHVSLTIAMRRKGDYLKSR